MDKYLESLFVITLLFFTFFVFGSSLDTAAETSNCYKPCNVEGKNDPDRSEFLTGCVKHIASKP
jgi:hypothetical protein